MHPIILLLFVLLAFIPTTPAAAAEKETGLSDVVRALEEPFRPGAAAPAPIVDFQADFFQESLVASLDRVQKGQGRVAVKFVRSRAEKPAWPLFRWEYEQPMRQIIVANAKTMWVYVPENRQVIQSDIGAAEFPRGEDPMAFLTGLGNLARDFEISWATPNRDGQGNFVLELRPRKPSAMLQKLLVVVAKDAVAELSRRGKPGGLFPILSTTVYDPSDNSTRIAFSAVKINRRLPDSFFDFVPPADVEIVRPNGQGLGF